MTAGGRVAPIGSGQWNPCGPLERGRTDTSESTSPPVTSGKKRRPISRPFPPPAYSAPGTHHHPSFNICYLTDNPGGSSILCALFVAPCLDCTTSSSSLSLSSEQKYAWKTQKPRARKVCASRPPASDEPAGRGQPSEEAFQTPQKRDVGRRFLSNGPLPPLPSLSVRRSPRAALASSVINRLQLAFLVDPVVRLHSSVGWPAFRGRGERDSFIVSAALICVLPRSPPPPSPSLSFCGCPLAGPVLILPPRWDGSG